MNFIPTKLKGAYVVEPSLIKDDRGIFTRTYCKKEFKQVDFDNEWVQMNHSVSFKKGTIRGLHFQNPPFSETKMVKCIQGAVCDVIVDLRKDSDTFLKWVAVELSAANKLMLFIPDGFAHGFQTMEESSELIYLHSNYYTPIAEAGLKFDDPLLGIEWPLPLSAISERDMGHKFIDKQFKGI